MKTKLLLGVLASLALTILAAKVDAELLLQYDLNEGSGTVIHDSVTSNANASVGGAGTIQWVQGHTADPCDKAINFNAARNGMNFIIGNKVPLAAITNKMSITVWQYGNDTLPNAENRHMFGLAAGVIAARTPYGGTALPHFAFNGQFFFGTTGTSALPNDHKVTEYKNKWNHYAFTKNAATGVGKIYINGALVGTSNTFTAAVPATITTGAFYVGMSGGGTIATNQYDGALDDFRIYNEELNAGQIQVIMGLSSPYPAHDETPLNNSSLRAPNRALTLTWLSGLDAVSHDVYFGTNAADVNNATRATQPIYKGNQTGNQLNLTDLQTNTYYWRIDEVQADSTVTKGKVWNFTPTCLPPYKPLGDLNSDCKVDFNDIGLMVGAWLMDQV